MAKHIDIGIEGENIALEYLKANQYEIIGQNVRIGRGEIDIIARDNEGFMRIIEVKTRKGLNNRPENAVDKRKQKMLFEAASIYKEENKLEEEIFFDILSIHLDKKNPVIYYFKDVFYEVDDSI